MRVLNFYAEYMHKKGYNLNCSGAARIYNFIAEFSRYCLSLEAFLVLKSEREKFWTPDKSQWLDNLEPSIM